MQAFGFKWKVKFNHGSMCLFHFVRNENYSTTDSCFHFYTVTSIDYLGAKNVIAELIKHAFHSNF